MVAAEKCARLADEEKASCFRQARRQGREPQSEAASVERGSADRVGAGSTGMAGGAPR